MTRELEIVVAAVVGLGMWLMGARCVNDVIPRPRRHGAGHRRLLGREWLQDAFAWNKCANKIDAVYLWSW